MRWENKDDKQKQKSMAEDDQRKKKQKAKMEGKAKKEMKGISSKGLTLTSREMFR
jgi:uncharacterized Fe-S cluster-containing protein